MSIQPPACSLARSYGHCKAITRERARNFYYGIRLSPEPHRSAILAIYAWMRLADDLVDSAGDMALPVLERRILAFRSATDAAIAGEPPTDSPLWTALADTVQRFQLSPVPFHEMLEGQLDDARRKTYDTRQQLLQYCRRVASTVGLICIDIWGYRDPAARELAAARGVAFQLTNMLRDFAEDYDAGRVYVPQEDLTRFHVSPDDLRAWREPQRCERLVGSLVDFAQEHYRVSAPLDRLIHPCGRATLWAMTTIYRTLLQKIAAEPRKIAVGRRVRLNALKKGAIAFRASWLARFRGDRRDLVDPRPGNASA
jgi:phytoene synthase